MRHGHRWLKDLLEKRLGEIQERKSTLIKEFEKENQLLMTEVESRIKQMGSKSD